MVKTVLHPEGASAEGGTVISLREEHKRVTRARLVEAAEKLFKEYGYRATTVEQIARAAGTTATTFYRHFKSKADLAGILQTELTAEVLGVLRKLETVRNPTRQAVRTWVGDYFAMWLRMHVLCEAYWEATTTDPELASYIMPASMAMTSQLTQFLQRFPDRLRERVQLRLTVLVLALDRLAFVANSQGGNPQESAIFDEFADIMFDAIYELGRKK